MRRRLWTVAVAALVAPFASVAPAHAAVSPVARVNFQPATAAVPAGYTADTGLGFDATRGSGWVVAGTHDALDLSRNTRDRARTGIDARLNTLIHLQYGDVGGTSGVVTPGAWEYALSPGSYQVTVSVGDQPAYDSAHTIRVEGATAVSGFVSTTAAEFRTATVTVPVSDGRLTVDATGGTNTKPNYLEIARVGAPAVPTGLTATPGDAQVALAWTASAAADLAGYRVYRGGTLVSGTAPLTRATWLDTTARNGTAYGYTVTAVDSTGTESPPSATVTATPAASALKVNFSDAATAPPTGYVRDSGDAFSTARGYGWVQLGTTTPLSLAGGTNTKLGLR
jgi:hypothetical protein